MIIIRGIKIKMKKKGIKTSIFSFYIHKSVYNIIACILSLLLVLLKKKTKRNETDINDN